MSFFIRGKQPNINSRKTGETLKRKRLIKKNKKLNPQGLNSKRAAPTRKDDEEILSEDEEDFFENGHAEEPEIEEDIAETAQEKKLRLAKIYLEEIERQTSDRAEARDIDRDAIGDRIKDDILEQAGRLRKTVADNYVGYDEEGKKLLRCKEHSLPITCLAVSLDGQFAYSASKDCGIVKWCLKERRKLNSIPGGRKGTEDKHKGHTRIINCLAVSSDNKFLTTGDDSGSIHVWNADTLELLRSFRKHRDGVTGLAFRRDTHQLFSVSKDRTVKIWSMDEMAYVESLFGHQSSITAVDVLTRERAVTSGGTDNSLRIWKVVEESQLIYNGHRGSIDGVRLINEEHFFSCGDDGMLCLWGAMKKKPLCIVENAHGVNSENQQPNWISSIASHLNTDLVASGSCDGVVRLWKCGDGFRTLTPLLTIPVVGFINAMAFTPDGSALLVGVGQEHRMGRWWRIKEARNGLLIIPLKQEDNNVVTPD